jgi:hypothetical protein
MLRLPFLRCATCVAVLATAAMFQDTGPERRAHHGMVFHDDLGKVLLVGGSSPIEGGEQSKFFDDVWSFDGQKWKLVAATGDRRSDVGLAYDLRAKRLVSFGGFTGETFGDLRVLEETKWRVLDENPSLALAGSGFVYDGGRNRFLVFGGSAGPDRIVGETWEHDGKTWTKFEGATPPARQSHTMVYDVKRARTVVFGGRPAAEPGSRRVALADTWEFDGKAWRKIEVEGPSGRSGSGAAYDTKRARVILFGGRGGEGFLADTWAFDGKTWQKLSDSGPEARGMGYLAYDKVRDRVVLFGGRKGWPDGDFADTWEFDGKAWQQVGKHLLR